MKLWPQLRDVTDRVASCCSCWIIIFALFLPFSPHSPTHNHLLFFFPLLEGVKLNFVQCIGCNLVLVYKSRTGTASLLRHRCPSFPISVYELKLENQKHLLALAGHQLFSEMASSSNNGIVELKQEMLSEEDSMDHDEQQFSNDQTDEGLLQSFSLLEKSFMGSDDVLLSREEIESAYRNQDPDLFFER